MSTVTILANPVIAQLHKPDRDVRLFVSEVLSYKVAGSEHMNQYSWDGHSSLFNFGQNSFPAGFVRLLQKKLEMAGHTVIVRRKEAPLPGGLENPKVDDFADDLRYDYQPKVVDRLIELKGMIAQVATGGGKSRIFKMATARLGMPTLFITTRKSLMYQMAESYEATMGVKVGILGDGQWSPRPNGVNFAIVNTLSMRLEETTLEAEIQREVGKHHDKVQAKIEECYKVVGLPTNTRTMRGIPDRIREAMEKVQKKVHDANPLEEKKLAAKLENKVADKKKQRSEAINLLSGIGFLCLEEAHEVSGDGYFKISKACKAAHFRLALTATPFMKDDQEANMRLMAVTGPIGIRVSEKLLIDRGILAKPYFKFIRPANPSDLFRSTPWQRAYTLGIVENESRNASIIAETKRATSHGLPVMILVQQTKHGKLLEKALTASGIRTKFIYGKHEQRDRKAALDALGSGEIDCLIGSTILDVGVDVPAVGMVILAGGGKAEVSLRQRVGRGLREKKSGPNVCFIVDFDDSSNNHLRKHSVERRRIIEDTPGFAEGIVGDFDYSIFKEKPL